MIITIIIWNIQFIVPLSFIGREVVTSIPWGPWQEPAEKTRGENQNHVLHTRVRNFEVPLGILVMWRILVNLQEVPPSLQRRVCISVYLFVLRQIILKLFLHLWSDSKRL